jgi:hypothetical protein
MPKQLAGKRSVDAERERALIDLAAATALRAALDQLERDAIDAAIDAGAMWSEVGNALGVTRSAAFQRYQRLHC